MDKKKKTRRWNVWNFVFLPVRNQIRRKDYPLIFYFTPWNTYQISEQYLRDCLVVFLRQFLQQGIIGARSWGFGLATEYGAERTVPHHHYTMLTAPVHQLILSDCGVHLRNRKLPVKFLIVSRLSKGQVLTWWSS